MNGKLIRIQLKTKGKKDEKRLAIKTKKKMQKALISTNLLKR